MPGIESAPGIFLAKPLPCIIWKNVIIWIKDFRLSIEIVCTDAWLAYRFCEGTNTGNGWWIWNAWDWWNLWKLTANLEFRIEKFNLVFFHLILCTLHVSIYFETYSDWKVVCFNLKRTRIKKLIWNTQSNKILRNFWKNSIKTTFTNLLLVQVHNERWPLKRIRPTKEQL